MSSDESRAEDEADISVYAMTERMAGGVQISPPGQRDVAKELLRVRDQVEALARSMGLL